MGSGRATFAPRGTHAAASTSVVAATVRRLRHRAEPGCRPVRTACRGGLGPQGLELPLRDAIVWLTRQRALEGVPRALLVTQLS